MWLPRHTLGESCVSVATPRMTKPPKFRRREAHLVTAVGFLSMSSAANTEFNQIPARPPHCRSGLGCLWSNFIERAVSALRRRFPAAYVILWWTRSHHQIDNDA
jgi:hypothetical protein